MGYGDIAAAVVQRSKAEPEDLAEQLRKELVAHAKDLRGKIGEGEILCLAVAHAGREWAALGLGAQKGLIYCDIAEEGGGHSRILGHPLALSFRFFIAGTAGEETGEREIKGFAPEPLALA